MEGWLPQLLLASRQLHSQLFARLPQQLQLLPELLQHSRLLPELVQPHWLLPELQQLLSRLLRCLQQVARLHLVARFQLVASKGGEEVLGEVEVV